VIEGGPSAPSDAGIRRNRLVGCACQETRSVADNRGVACGLLPVLWMPQLDTQISAVTSKLKGVYPQDPLGDICPENWYYVK
jgi:hypothetical protein